MYHKKSHFKSFSTFNTKENWIIPQGDMEWLNGYQWLTVVEVLHIRLFKQFLSVCVYWYLKSYG